jgi:hypothetical protein
MFIHHRRRGGGTVSEPRWFEWFVTIILDLITLMAAIVVCAFDWWAAHQRDRIEWVFGIFVSLLVILLVGTAIGMTQAVVKD